jgi:hypothetical protein
VIPKLGLPQRIVVEGSRLLRSEGVEVGLEGVVDLAGDVALETAHDLALRFALLGASFGVGSGAPAVGQPADGDEVKRSVGLAITTGVEAMPGGLARGCGDRACAAERCERRFAV